MAVIGITVASVDSPPRHQLNTSYVRSVLGAGGVPFLLPVHEDLDLTPRILERIDGLILSGGVDVDPHLFGQEPLPGLGPVSPERDRSELALTREALAAGMPILAICRGIQVLNVAAGGTIIQDVDSARFPDLLKHRQEAPWWHASHAVEVEPGSRLADLLGLKAGMSTIRVNSFHHQAVDRVAEPLTAVARSPDGVVEAVEHRDDRRFVVGVQWHPEGMVDRHARQRGLFRGLVRAARPGEGRRP